MRTAAALATVVGDTAFAAECRTAEQRAQGQMDALLWNEQGKAWDAYTTGEGTVMADTHYAQVRISAAASASTFIILSVPVSVPDSVSVSVSRAHTHAHTHTQHVYTRSAFLSYTFFCTSLQVLAHTLGLGLLVQNQSRLLMHLGTEAVTNAGPYGLVILTGRGHTSEAEVAEDKARWATVEASVSQISPARWEALETKRGEIQATVEGGGAGAGKSSSSSSGDGAVRGNVVDGAGYGQTEDDVWMMAPADHAALLIHNGGNVGEALAEAKKPYVSGRREEREETGVNASMYVLNALMSLLTLR